MIRILHLRSTTGFYGAENVILHLAVLLRDQADITVAVFIRGGKDDKALLTRCLAQNIKTFPVYCPGLISPRAIAAVRTAVKENNVEVLHTHGYKSTIIGWLATLGLKVRRVATNHLWDRVNRKLWWYQRLEGIVYNFFDRVVAVSNPVADDVRPFLFNKSKLSVIPNGIDVDHYADSPNREKVRAGVGVKPDEILLGMVGRLAPQKGHHDMINAAKLLASRYSHVKVAFWGHGPLESELRRTVEESGLRNIIFAGVADDMPGVYAAIDILALPSLSEGLPMALLEAMAAGVPVVATPVGDIPKVITDQVSGYIVPVHDSEALYQEISRIIDNPSHARQMVLKAGEFVRGRYSARAMAKEYLTLYEKIN